MGLRTGSRVQEVVFGVACADLLLDAERGDAAATVIGQVRSIVARTPMYGCIGAVLESAVDVEAAIAYYLRGVDADPVVEAFHQGLMRCYAGIGRRTEAISAYRRMRQTLSVVLGVPPSDDNQRLYRQLVGAQLAEGGDPATSGAVVAFERPGQGVRGRR